MDGRPRTTQQQAPIVGSTLLCILFAHTVMMMSAFHDGVSDAACQAAPLCQKHTRFMGFLVRKALARTSWLPLMDKWLLHCRQSLLWKAYWRFAPTQTGTPSPWLSAQSARLPHASQRIRRCRSAWRASRTSIFSLWLCYANASGAALLHEPCVWVVLHCFDCLGSPVPQYWVLLGSEHH